MCPRVFLAHTTKNSMVYDGKQGLVVQRSLLRVGWNFVAILKALFYIPAGLA